MGTILTVTKVGEELSDKNGRNYRQISLATSPFQTMVDTTTGETVKVRRPVQHTSINRYKESYLNDEMEFLYDAEINERVAGSIVTKSVNAYEIDGKEVQSYTTVVLGDSDNEDAFELLTNQAFRNAGHQLPTDPYTSDSSTPSSTPRVKAQTKDKAKVEDIVDVDEEF